MTKQGEIINVKVDPETNGGFDTAPALVTGVHDDGSLAVRVFGVASAGDSVRNYVGDDGEPFDYGNQAAPTASPANTAAATPLTSGMAGVNQQPAAPAAAEVPTVEQLRDYSPEQRAELLAELQQLDTAPAPASDGTPGADTTSA